MKKAFHVLSMVATLAIAPAWAAQSERATYEVTHIPATLATNIPTTAEDFEGTITGSPLGPHSLDREPADKARFAAFRKNYIITATVDGRAFRTMNMVVDSEGLAYSTSQQSFTDPAGDTLWVHVTSYEPLIVDFKVVNAYTRIAASRDRVAVGDMAVGAKSRALQDARVTVEVERLPDDVDLRARSLLRDEHVQLIKTGANCDTSCN